MKGDVTPVSEARFKIIDIDSSLIKVQIKDFVKLIGLEFKTVTGI
jgi:hypothetical protein